MSKAPLRVLQLIDSLEAGGSERMAVQIANQLSGKTSFTGLVSTRKEGLLKYQIEENVEYFCLYKKKTFDLLALKKLYVFVNKHKVNVIHTHSTSFFLGTLLKLLKPTIKLIWHDHYGYRYQTKIKENKVLNLCSSKFNHIICINSKLERWAKENLKCEHVSYIENFSIKPELKNLNKVFLKGKKDEFKIVHLANLRPEKDHISALKAIKILLEKGYNVSYHSIGSMDIDEAYSSKILSFISDNNLEKKAFIYNSRSNVYDFLNQANAGILTSTSEGFPVSIVEYAMAKIPVIATDVGECKNIVSNFGEIVRPEDENSISNSIEKFILNKKWALTQADGLNKRVESLYNKDLITNKIIDIYRTLIES